MSETGVLEPAARVRVGGVKLQAAYRGRPVQEKVAAPEKLPTLVVEKGKVAGWPAATVWLEAAGVARLTAMPGAAAVPVRVMVCGLYGNCDSER